MNFRLLTYNIHKCIGGIDRRYAPDRVADTIAHYNADIVLLQEVDDGVPRSRKHRQVDWLGNALSFGHRYFQANVGLTTGKYGNAILSRYPLETPQRVDLTIPWKKRRGALVTRVHFRGSGGARSLVLANVHLGLAGLERVAQLRRLIGHPKLARAQHATPLIVAGDFNDVWATLGEKVLRPAGFQSAAGDVKTFPAAFPLRSLDRVFYRGDLRLKSCFVGRTDLAKHASDHLPLIADFEVVGLD